MTPVGGRSPAAGRVGLVGATSASATRPGPRRVRLPAPLSVALLALLVGLLPTAGSAGAEGYGPPTLLATLADGKVAESSGLVGSRRAPGVLWTHNDSGDGPILYATDRAGRALGRWLVDGAANADWEDIALGPGPDGGDALYVADTGDNALARDDAALYRVPEPAIGPAIPVWADPIRTAPAERISLAYPDGRRDVEALLAHPRTGEILLIAKEPTGPAGVYRLPDPPPAATATPAVLVRVADLALPGLGPLRAVTGGAVAPDGSRLALRTPVAAFEWPLPAGGSLADALAGTPARIPLPAARGEAVAYSADSAALLASNEGVPCPLYELVRG